MAAPAGSLAAAEANADGKLTILDDKIDVEDHVAFLWLKAHQLKGVPHLKVVIGAEILPPDWNARKKPFATIQSAQSYLQPFIRSHTAVTSLQTLARSLAPPQLKPPTNPELVAAIADSLVAGRAWVIELKVGAPTSRFHIKADPGAFAPVNAKYGTRIDFAAISHWEGDQYLRGYIPLEGKSGKVSRSSGMTIASGFDLGRHNLSDLKRLALPQSISDKIKNFLSPVSFKGMTKQEAATAVGKLGPVPVLTQAEVNLCDIGTFTLDVIDGIDSWNALISPGVPRFTELPAGWQTVWASRMHQEGKASKIGHAVAFRNAARAGNWKLAVEKLQAYPVDKPRITEEVAMLKKVMPADLPAPKITPKQNAKPAP